MQREEIPPASSNMFHFADIDRDGMVDMLFMTKQDLSFHLYYNKLQSIQPIRGISLDQLGLCHPANRPINQVSPVFSSFDRIEEKFVVKQQFSDDLNAVDI